jgi:hypothetical protein
MQLALHGMRPRALADYTMPAPPDPYWLGAFLAELALADALNRPSALRAIR